VSVGSTNIAAIKTDGSLWMSGKNLNGVLGNNQNTAYDTNVFEQIAVNTVWKEVTLGGKDADPTFASYTRDQTAYAIDVNNNLWCWGRYLTGALNPVSSPVQLTSFGNGWKTVKSAYNANVGIKTDGSLWTWGDSASDTFGFGIFNSGQFLPSQALIGTKGKWKSVDISKSGSGVNFGHQYGAGNIFAIEK
jgi:alpha-tubulin suppressor-like RCC1 family protein